MTLNSRVIDEFGTSIHEHLLALESESDICGFLDSHDISAQLRAKMIDWQVEVLSTFKMSD